MGFSCCSSNPLFAKHLNEMSVNEMKLDFGNALEAANSFLPEKELENAVKIKFPEDVDALNTTEDEEPRNLDSTERFANIKQKALQMRQKMKDKFDKANVTVEEMKPKV